MRIVKAIAHLGVLCALAAPACVAKVIVRWTEKGIPAAKSLGVGDLAIPWSDQAKELGREARKKGYRVFFEVTEAQASDAVAAQSDGPVSGLILVAATGGKVPAASVVEGLRAKNPKLEILEASPEGKQPQMRGQTVYERNGVLQVSSPTAQPWVDSNLAAVRLEAAFGPGGAPTYTFAWGAPTTFEGQKGPIAADYSLAISEAGAFQADVVLPIEPELQKDLAREDKNAWEMWKKVKAYLAFYERAEKQGEKALTNVAVWADNEDNVFEAANLMARHNIAYRVPPASAWNAAGLAGAEVLLVFAQPTKEQALTLIEFATRGGAVVLVNASGAYPWQSEKPEKTEQATIYTVGLGKILEVAGGVTNPEAFAKDVRRLMKKDGAPVTLWNSLTALVVPYQTGNGKEMVLELLNYEESPGEVQLQVEGKFRTIRYETPEGGCCQTIQGTIVGDSTEFVVTHLVIGGRVHLSGAH